MTARLDPSLGGTTTPHRWQPIDCDPGERIRCSVCGSEDRWSHPRAAVPSPRPIPREERAK